MMSDSTGAYLINQASLIATRSEVHLAPTAQSIDASKPSSPRFRRHDTSDPNVSRGDGNLGNKPESGSPLLERHNAQAVNCGGTRTEAVAVSNEPSTKSASPCDHQSTTTPPKTPRPGSDQIKRAPTTSSAFPNTSQARQHISNLQKQVSSLHAQLSTLRTDLDTATQAIRIEQSNQDPELEGLIYKWQIVAREAAEELFASARERVNRMGGVGVWKDRMRQSKLRRMKWDAEENDTGGTDEDGDEDEGSDLEKDKDARRKEIEGEIEAGEKSDREQEEDDSGEDDEVSSVILSSKESRFEKKSNGGIVPFTLTDADIFRRRLPWI
ncbi:hypothetical protein CISG_00412 [Coccidioides immitis RMSCC 3703]|uniref:Uncharacterized protein n=1 Tax=Coccidioides immitis RMSCC 3703 TaxID=454286 RepID=A0A0J8QLR1_COCIT|nr:hypothetical protein CISG_00412 [Coccidioides immitis RMSCC 3703]